MRHPCVSSPLTGTSKISHKQPPDYCLLLFSNRDVCLSLGLAHEVTKPHPAVRLLGDPLDLGRVEDMLENGHVRRAGGD